MRSLPFSLARSAQAGVQPTPYLRACHRLGSEDASPPFHARLPQAEINPPSTCAPATGWGLEDGFSQPLLARLPKAGVGGRGAGPRQASKRAALAAPERAGRRLRPKAALPLRGHRLERVAARSRLAKGSETTATGAAALRPAKGATRLAAPEGAARAGLAATAAKGAGCGGCAAAGCCGCPLAQAGKGVAHAGGLAETGEAADRWRHWSRCERDSTRGRKQGDG